MIRHGSPPYLECSSRGDRRFSALFAEVNGRTIEEQYQLAKRFDSDPKPISYGYRRTKFPSNLAEVRALYSRLWDQYITEHPELVPVLIAATGLSDVFGVPGHACQATELWRIRGEIIARGEREASSR